MGISVMRQVALITGSSSGIGYETSLALARSGFCTYAGVRNTKNSDILEKKIAKEKLDLNILQLDVNDKSSIDNAINRIKTEEKRIDVLINNAGYGLVGFFEELGLDEIRKQFETNFFGVLNVTIKVIPIMREQNRGTIINLSSGAGQVGFPGISAYVSTKFAIEGFSESLMYELFPFGIRVIIIEPGVIKTNFFNNCIVSDKSSKKGSLYSNSLKKIQNNIVGNDAVMIFEAKRSLSDIEFKKMMMQNII